MLIHFVTCAKKLILRRERLNCLNKNNIPRSTSTLEHTCTELCQISKIKCFAHIVNPLTIFGKHSILDVWQGSEYASEDHINYGNL